MPDVTSWEVKGRVRLVQSNTLIREFKVIGLSLLIKAGDSIEQVVNTSGKY